MKPSGIQKNSGERPRWTQPGYGSPTPCPPPETRRCQQEPHIRVATSSCFWSSKSREFSQSQKDYFFGSSARRRFTETGTKSLKHRHRPSREKQQQCIFSRGDFLFLPQEELQKHLPIVLVREAIFLFVSAKRAPVNKAPLALLEKCRDRLHEPTTRSQTIPWMDINMTTPEASGTVIGIAIPSHLRPALPAHKILNLFLKLFGRHHRSVLLQEDSIWSN